MATHAVERLERRSEPRAKRTLRARAEKAERRASLAKIACSVSPTIHGIQHHGTVTVAADNTSCEIVTASDPKAAPKGFDVRYTLPCVMHTTGYRDPITGRTLGPDERLFEVPQHWSVLWTRDPSNPRHWIYGGAPDAPESMSDGPTSPGIACDGLLP
jgi:hypothetical protein